MDRLSITSLLGQMSMPRLRALFAQDARRRRPTGCSSPLLKVCRKRKSATGRMLLEGTGLPQDPVQALKWFRRAASSGDIDAMRHGRALPSIRVGARPKIPRRPRPHFRRAADAGHAWAQYNLGPPVTSTAGVLPCDRTLAYRYYLKAAGQQHDRAMSLVGRCCEEGWGTRETWTASRRLVSALCRGWIFPRPVQWGQPAVQSRRFEEAAAWFERAAVGGTVAVRRAVVELIARAGAPRALRSLSARLQAGRLSPASP